MRRQISANLHNRGLRRRLAALPLGSVGAGPCAINSTRRPRAVRAPSSGFVLPSAYLRTHMRRQIRANLHNRCLRRRLGALPLGAVGADCQELCSRALISGRICVVRFALICITGAFAGGWRHGPSALSGPGLAQPILHAVRAPSSGFVLPSANLRTHMRRQIRAGPRTGGAEGAFDGGLMRSGDICNILSGQGLARLMPAPTAGRCLRATVAATRHLRAS